MKNANQNKVMSDVEELPQSNHQATGHSHKMPLYVLYLIAVTKKKNPKTPWKNVN